MCKSKIIQMDMLDTGGTDPHSFTVEASTLGLRPGEWPEMLQTKTKLGNGLPFVRKTKKLDSNGDLMHVRYLQAAGCVSIVVFND